MYNAYFFYKQNFIYYLLDRFLSVKQSKTAFLRHSKTPAPVGNADSTGVFKQNIAFFLPVFNLSAISTRDFCNMLHFSLLKLPFPS